MTDSIKEQAIIQARLERFQKIVLPDVLAMKDRVDAGETLSSRDVEFLAEVLENARTALPVVERHPEYKELAARAIHLYNEITAKALENEKKT